MNLLDMVMSRSDRLVAPLAGYPGVRLAGRSVREALHDATVQLEALKSLEERLRPDIVFPLLDLTVEAESMGLGVNFHDKLPPSLAQQKLPMLDRFYALGLPDPEKAGRMPVFLEVAEGLSARGGRMRGAYVTGPLSLLAQLLGTGEPLARALDKLDLYSQRIPADINPAQAQAYIVNPLRRGGMASLFSTHPPVEERISRLRGGSWA